MHQTPGLTAEVLLSAYRRGIFPMAEDRDDPRLFWFDPQMRGILPLDGFRMSRSLARRIRAGGYEVTLDGAFGEVIAGCAARETTWINAEIEQLFMALHHEAHAHSIEIWHQGVLTGGVYGLVIGGAFCGESMFSRRTDASKIALAYLVTHLRRAGFTLFDTQFLTEHLATLGGIEVSRAHYHALLHDALGREPGFHRRPLPSAHDVLQLSTQMS